MRVVLDPNAFGSSFFGGNPRRVVDLCKEGPVTLCPSQDIVEEYLEVLARLGLAEEPEGREIADLFARGFHSVFAASPAPLRVVADGPDGDKFIERGVASGANWVITGDRALLAVGSYVKVRIVSPAEFLRRVQSRPSRPAPVPQSTHGAAAAAFAPLLANGCHPSHNRRSRRPFTL